MKHPLHIRSRVLDVVKRLRRSGFETYIVGGAVRDLLSGREPKDFDVSTSATPEQIRDCIGRRNARIIGKRFRLVHVTAGGELFEVSTFRRAPSRHAGDAGDEGGGLPENLILSDNDFGTAREDAFRRDFTVNALFYDPVDEEILDLTGQGLADIEARRVRAIGEPRVRFEEDPVRMLRALKLVGQYDFSLDAATENALFSCLPLLMHASQSRLSLELEKILTGVYGDLQLRAFHDYGLLEHFLPFLDKRWGTPACESALRLLAARNDRVEAGKYRNSISVAAACLLFPFAAERLGGGPDELRLLPGVNDMLEKMLRKEIFAPQTLMLKVVFSAQRIVKFQPLF